MLSQCCSGSSIAIYVPALYACQLASERLHMHPMARPFAMGLLLCLHSAPHLLLGAQQGWWALSLDAPLPLSGASRETAEPAEASRMVTLSTHGAPGTSGAYPIDSRAPRRS